jgi:hypothetical protein
MKVLYPLGQSGFSAKAVEMTRELVPDKLTEERVTEFVKRQAGHVAGVGQPDVLQASGDDLQPSAGHSRPLPLGGRGHRRADRAHLRFGPYPAQCHRGRRVGAYIGAAYFFCSSTSFANPAVTVGRMFSNTFAGIAPSSVPTFIAAQALGGLVAYGLIKLLSPTNVGEDNLSPVVASAKGDA